jgi:hypothetical protein
MAQSMAGTRHRARRGPRRAPRPRDGVSACSRHTTSSSPAITRVGHVTAQGRTVPGTAEVPLSRPPWRATSELDPPRPPAPEQCLRPVDLPGRREKRGVPSR